MIPNKGFTHGGTFHSDDVFSTALLKILNPDIEIQRGFEIPENFDGIVYDIGLGKFDHHQLDNEVRKNGVPYASFGKLWKEYGTMLFTENQCNLFDIGFIQSLDNSDNTGEKDSLSTVISNMNPAWDDVRTTEECFEEAVQFATYILNVQFDKIRAKERANAEVAQKIKEMKDGILILDKHMPYQEQAIKNKNVKFAIYPSNRGGYNIQVVPKTFHTQEGRVPFPNEWLGASKEILDSYVKGMYFCHKANFLASADTLENAINVAITAKNYRKR